MPCDCAPAAIAARLASCGDYRVLRRLDLDLRVLPLNDDAGTRVGVCVDVETTGTDARSDEIVELSLRRFRFDDGGIITKLDRSYTWLEEPSRPITPEASAVNGLSKADLRGRAIDDASASALLRSADVRVAFNAAFDRKFIERRLPQVCGLAWACAMREVDWRGRGFDGSGRSLGWILAQCGYYNDRAHRAVGDVDAAIAVLEHRGADGPTALFELMERAAEPGWHVSAVGAHFDVKDALKARGYRWDGEEKAWWREVSASERDAECAWLAFNVYAPHCRARTGAPVMREVTWLERHA